MPTVSQAKNVMQRTLSEIVDPGLTPALVDALWKHFEASCAYCGVHIERASRRGHIDHLESGGGNGPRNRVLACASCNGDEKREHDWRVFLREKCPETVERQQRIERIETWVSTHSAHNSPLSPVAKEALQEAERIIDEFHAACTKLREVMKSA